MKHTLLLHYLLFLYLSQVAHQSHEAGQAADIEDFGMSPKPLQPAILISTKRKRASQGDDSQVESQDVELTQSWREILGPPPPRGTTRVGKEQCPYSQCRILMPLNVVKPF